MIAESPSLTITALLRINLGHICRIIGAFPQELLPKIIEIEYLRYKIRRKVYNKQGVSSVLKEISNPLFIISGKSVSGALRPESRFSCLPNATLSQSFLLLARAEQSLLPVTRIFYIISTLSQRGETSNQQLRQYSMAKTPKLDLETTFSKLETTIDKLEDEQASLQESLNAFEQGIKLTRQAQQTLFEAEQKVKLLLDEAGEPKSQEFTDGKAE
jgi:exodeoxyribonuclease VII small subunit